MLELSLTENRPGLLRLWRAFLALAVLQCLAALGITWSLRAVASNTRGLIEFIIAGAVLLLLFGFIVLLVQAWTNRALTDQRLASLLRFVRHPNRFAFLAVLTSALFFLGVFTATLVPETSEPFTRVILEKALPVALLAAGLSLQTLAGLLIIRHGGLRFDLSGKRVFGSILILTLAFFLYWSWLLATVIPSVSRVVGWNTMGVPILEQQVLIAWLLGMGMLLLIHLANVRPGVSGWVSRIKTARIDLGISLLIWLAAILAWQSIPVQPNWFLTERMYPNFESYPSSDASLYDRAAQSALVGSGYRFIEDFNIRRPLHALYLTLLHLLAGQNYERLVFYQIIVLAIFPVILFWLAKSLQDRVSGVIAAALVIFREANAIILSGAVTNANAKLLMVDLPTALLLSLFFLLAILWLKKDPDNALWAPVCGQALGLAILIRPETMILGAVPIFVLLMLVWRRKPGWKFLRQSALFAFGALLVLSPWVWRNWRQTGLIYLNDPYFRFGIIKQRFGPEIQKTIPDEVEKPVTSGPDLGRLQAVILNPQVIPTPTPGPRTPEEVEQAARERLQQELQDPLRLFQVNSAHYLNSQLQALLIFPSTFRGIDSTIGFLGHRNPSRYWFECCSATGYIRRLSYWPRWQGGFDLQSLAPLVLTIIILAAGIQTAWNRRGWIGLMILFGSTIYLIANAVFRNSGGRYILSVDWVFIAYYSIGLGQLSWAALKYLRGAEPHTLFPGEEDQGRWTYRSAAGSWLPAALAACFLMISVAVPLVEKSFPQIYTVPRKAQMLEILLTSDDVPISDQQALQAYLDQGVITVGGRVLYPQYLPKDVGSLGKEDAPIKPMPFPRLVFVINGERNLSLTLPVDDRTAPISNASDGVAFLCPADEGYALALGIVDSHNRVQSLTLISPKTAAAVCPLEPNSQ